MSMAAWEDHIQLKTYALGPEDPNPPWQRTGRARVYPYPMQDDLDLTHEPQPVSYRALHLENDYLHLIVLPELGGHVYSLYDNIMQREVFYRNNVVKYGLVARRAAWISGGIEFNFPQGHTCVTVSPVMSTILTDSDDGSASIVVGCTDRVSRMRWSVRLSLHPAEARLQQQVMLHNATAMRQHHYFWANSAMPATEDLRLVFPATRVRTSRGDHAYPILDGKDLSLYRNHERANDIFCLDATDDFFGCYYEQQDFGLVHWSDHRVDFGKKLFTWGTADAGMIWVDLLTDDDGQYVELQSGRFVDQRMFEFLGPYQTVAWNETWYPVHGTGGFRYADDRAALNLRSDGGKVHIGAMANMDLGRAELCLEHRGQKLWTKPVTLEPGKPVSDVTRIEAGIAEQDLGLVLLINGREALRYDAGARPGKVGPVGTRSEPAADTDEPAAEELCVEAVGCELRADVDSARELYRQALAKDPRLSSAYLGLGLLDLQAGLVDRTVEHLQQAVKRDRQNDEAWYYLALAQMAQGGYQEAQEVLSWLAGRTKCKAEAELMLAKLALRQARPSGALEFAALSAQSLDKAFLAAVSSRLMGAPAEHALRLSQARYPLVPEFIAEGLFRAFDSSATEGAEEALAKLHDLLGDDPEEWLELALRYVDCGLTQEAVRLLRIGCESHQAVAAAPMIHYHLAHWLAAGERDKERERAAAADPECCFPSRLEDLDMLNDAIASNPADWKARMYLGHLLASLGRRDDALAVWETAADTDDRNPVLCRNLALAYSLWRGDHQVALQWYNKAIARRPDDFHLHLERDDAFQRAGSDAQTRLAALQGAPHKLLGRWDIAARRIACLIQLERWDDALALLRTHRFIPWEGARGMHELWTQGLVGRAAERKLRGDLPGAVADYELALTYPRNLGVGRAPYPKEAQLHWLLADAAGQLADEEKRRHHLQAAAEERHASLCEADVFKARALRALGRCEEADDLAAQVRNWAEGII